MNKFYIGLFEEYIYYINYEQGITRKSFRTLEKRSLNLSNLIEMWGMNVPAKLLIVKNSTRNSKIFYSDNLFKAINHQKLIQKVTNFIYQNFPLFKDGQMANYNNKRYIVGKCYEMDNKLYYNLHDQEDHYNIIRKVSEDKIEDPYEDFCNAIVRLQKEKVKAIIVKNKKPINKFSYKDGEFKALKIPSLKKPTLNGEDLIAEWKISKL